MNKFLGKLCFILLLLFSSNALAKSVELTSDEELWLRSHKVIKIAIDSGFGPYSFIDDNGEFQGVVKDFLLKIEKLLGVHFEVVSNLSWTELIEAVKRHEIDAIATVHWMPEREQFLKFSQAYIETPLVLTTQKTRENINTSEEFLKLKFVLVEGYSSTKELLKKYPDLKFTYVSSPLEGLQDIASNKADAYVGALGVNEFLAARNGLNNLKVNVAVDMNTNTQSFGVRDDWELFAKLLDKALNAIPSVEKDKIFQQHLGLQRSELKRLNELNYILMMAPWVVGILVLLVIAYAFLTLWNYELKKELKKREQDLEKDQAIAHFGDWMFDLQSGRLKWSDELFRIAGREPNKTNTLDWKTLRAWIHPEDVLEHENVLRQLADFKLTDSPIIFISHLVGANGEDRYLEITNSVEFNKQGKAILYYGIARDISEQKHSEEKLKKQEELIISQSRHAAMGEMISMIAHQWRQPLSVISMGANNILASAELNLLEKAELIEAAKLITAQTQELSKTINDFKDFFKPKNKMDETYIQKIFDDAFGVIGQSLKNNNIEVIQRFNNATTIKTYSRELMQVFINILNNAKDALVEHVKENRVIWVSAEDVEESVLVKICDNAGGIQEEIIDKIYDPYFTTKGEMNGTGIGLYISKTIIEKHLEGTISASNIDNGVCFEIILPLKKNENPL